MDELRHRLATWEGTYNIRKQSGHPQDTLRAILDDALGEIDRYKTTLMIADDLLKHFACVLDEGNYSMYCDDVRKKITEVLNEPDGPPGG